VRSYLQMNAPRRIGRYLLYGPIASGGMATVHFGRLVDGGFARTVAIKRVRADSESTSEQFAMLADEARILSRVHHPNVPPILDVLALDDEIFLVMDFIAGASLSSLRRSLQGAPIEPSIACSVLAGVLRGLHAAHLAVNEQGESLAIVHRDVSPQNILVGVDGLARLLDFGVAKARGRLQSTYDGRLKGKLGYMSPEQVSSAPLTARSDVFAAGIVLWEALTGRRLFSADNEGGMLVQVLTRPIETPSHAGALSSPELDAHVLRALSRSLPTRFESAEAFAAALERDVPLAPPGEVGAWVRRTAGDALADQLAELARVEASSVSGQGWRASPKKQEDDEQTVSEVDVRHALVASSRPPAIQAQPSRSSKRYFGVVLVVIAVMIAVVGWLGLAPSAPAVATSVAAPSPPPQTATQVDAVTRPTAEASVKRFTPRRRAAPIKSKRCDPPYTIGSDGIQRLKPECM